jgi:Ca-activated chloride channel family protein
MKTLLCLLVILGAMLCASTSGMSRAPSDGEIRLDGRLSSPYISTAGGKAFLQLTLKTRGFRLPERKQMNLSVVLDRSGSMADERKIQYAKKALYALIDQLDSRDILSIVIYDDVIEVLSSAKKVGNKQALKRLVERIEPRGSTNLGGGMVEGLRQVEMNLDREYVNRVVLLSDGLANQGITDPWELNRIVRRYREKSISLTTMGVGLEYNENLMVGLAESGGGNYYFIESPHTLTAMVQKQLNSLSCIVAQNVLIELRLESGVRIIDVVGHEYRTERDVVRIPLGDLYTDDLREITVEMEIPGGRGSKNLAHGFVMHDAEGNRVQTSSFTANVRYSEDVSVVEKNRDWNVQAKADVAVSTRRVERAMKALDEGREAEAI